MTPHRFDAIAERLSRQTLLAELGREGMERIADARFLVVGAGGLGSPALIYLAASGGCRITVADPDTVSVTNLSRQLLHEEEALGVNKAKNAARVLPRYNPAVEVTPIDTYLDEKTLADVLDTVDIVLDCSDNLATRQSVNRAALKARKPLVFGSVSSRCSTSEAMLRPAIGVSSTRTMRPTTRKPPRSASFPRSPDLWAPCRPPKRYAWLRAFPRPG